MDPCTFLEAGLPISELYAINLRSCERQLGYALFNPSPAGYDRVCLGDIGYISEAGKFIPLLNAFNGDFNVVPRNKKKGSNFPGGFRGMDPAFLKNTKRAPLDIVRLGSRGVEFLTEQSSLQPFSNSDLTVRVMVPRDISSGAVLIAKAPDKFTVTIPRGDLEKHLVTNRKYWINTRTRGLNIELHDLVLVWECTVTDNVAVYAWNRSGDFAHLHARNTQVGRIGVTRSPDKRVLEVEMSEITGMPKNQDTQQATEGLKCIALKGCRIAARDWYKQLYNKTGKPAKDAALIRRDCNRPVLKALGETELGHYPNARKHFKPIRNIYELVAIFIFDNSEKAEFAIVDDEDISLCGLDKESNLLSICGHLIGCNDIGIKSKTFPDRDGTQVEVHRIYPKPPVISKASDASTSTSGLSRIPEEEEDCDDLFA